MSRTAIVAIALGLAGLTGGCAKTDSDLSGAVLFDGKPVFAGEIVFTPDETRGNPGPGVLVEIKDGQYATTSERGHWGGPYKAHVTIFQGMDTLVSNYETDIDLPEGDTNYDLDIPKSAAGRR